MPNERRVQMGLALLFLALLDVGAVYVWFFSPPPDYGPAGALLTSRVISLFVHIAVGGWLLWRANVNRPNRDPHV